MKNLTTSIYAILGLLSKKSPLSGYDIKCLLGKISKYYWSESNAGIYPILKKLEANQLVTSSIDPESGGRKRKIYQITQAGQETLLNWLREASELNNYREELLLKLAYAQHLNKNEVHKHLLDYQQQVETKLHHINSVIEHIESDHAGRKDQAHLLMIYDHVKSIFETKLAWCKKYLSQN